MPSTPSIDLGQTFQLDKLRDSDIPATARLLADSFADNPAYAFMHPRFGTRASDLTSFFERNLSWHMPVDLTWIARAASGEVVGTATPRHSDSNSGGHRRC